MSKSTDAKIRRHIEARSDVVLYRNDDTGILWWSICVASNPELWLESFIQETVARQWCKERSLKIVGTKQSVSLM
jgi:hypothetical protein